MRSSALLAASLLALSVPAHAADEALTLQPTRPLKFTATTATWTQLDLSPDGRTILFDLLGDIYVLDAKGGGAARPVLTGMAFESNPVFSPDGKRFAFVSDRSGAMNLWIANLDGTGLKQLSRDSGMEVWSSPAWSPDGSKVYASRMTRPRLAFELFLFDVDGGAGVQITEAGSPSNWDTRHNALGAVASPDGNFLYYSTKLGHTWTEDDPPNWQIARRDLRTGAEDMAVSAPGGALHPALSHDGRLLAYASRNGAETGLRLRDLVSGEDRWIAAKIDHDAQEGGYYADLTPRFTFVPDDKSIVMGLDGGIARLDIATGKVAPIPFTAAVDQAMGPLTRVSQKQEDGPVRARIIQGSRQSPDGKALAFTALGALYVQPLVGGAPRKLVPADAFQPSWSPDGRTLVYVTWTAKDGGQVWTIPAGGGKPRQLTRAPAYYTEPRFTRDGRNIAFLRASQFDRLQTVSEIDPARPTDIVTLPASGGEPRLVAHAFGARSLQLGPDAARVWFLAPAGLSSVPLAGGSAQVEVKVVARNMGQYVGVPTPVQDLRLSPDGRQVLARAASELYLVDIPPANGAQAPTIDLDAPSIAARKLTRIGADFVDWSDDGSTLAWSVGATWRRIAVATAAAAAPGAAEAAAETHRVEITLPRFVPQGVQVLRGATVYPMAGPEVIRDADVVVSANRVLAVGPRGSVAIPAGAQIRDVAGKFIVPGFVDTHAHWFEIGRTIQDRTHWDFAVNLAYGVTSGLDPQPFTWDAFVYQDMIDAGMMPGPRAWSTGPGVFVNSNIASKQDAIDVLTRYRDYYGTRNIKQYMAGGRAVRQYVIEAAKDLGMMPTTEGAADLTMDLTHALDGYSGNEHALPISPLHDDVIQLIARSRMSYTPTIGVLYGGGGAYAQFIRERRPDRDPKWSHFVPDAVAASKLRNRHWLPGEGETYQRFARDALEVQRAGGLIGVGSHGEIQGLGYHWEMEALASGGGTPMEVLHAATIGSAEVIGHQADVGSLEPGKYADLVILDADPAADITNTTKISGVMKGGFLYDPDTLAILGPQPRAAPDRWFAADK
jgi:Tol biopolymer transport system component